MKKYTICDIHIYTSNTTHVKYFVNTCDMSPN